MMLDASNTPEWARTTYLGLLNCCFTIPLLRFSVAKLGRSGAASLQNNSMRPGNQHRQVRTKYAGWPSARTCGFRIGRERRTAGRQELPAQLPGRGVPEDSA